MRSSPHLSDDTNQFGPGSDLMISLAAVLLMLTAITSHMYARARQQAEADRARYEVLRTEHVQDSTRYEEQRRRLARDFAAGGSFRVATASIPAADFHPYPVTRLVRPEQTELRVQQIVAEYRRQDYPYIFVIGHSSGTDDPAAADRSRRARLQRNWEYAGRRAALVAALIEPHLTEAERGGLVVMTMGELDMRDPANPLSRENAWVEVVFGKEWKPPSRAAPG